MRLRDASWMVMVGALLASGCSAVRESWVRPDYAQVDRTETLRLAVVTAPLPEDREDLGHLWSLVARRYVNHHRDFIVREDRAAARLPEDACAGVEGLLHLVPEVRREGDGVRAEVRATLLRCADRETVWRAEAGGSWPLADAHLTELADFYAEAVGEGVRPYVPATFHLLRATLDTLPFPELTRDEDVMEKIELGE